MRCGIYSLLLIFSAIKSNSVEHDRDKWLVVLKGMAIFELFKK